MAPPDRNRVLRLRGAAVLLLCILGAGSTGLPGFVAAEGFTAVTFNVGTNPGLDHDADLSDGYTQVEANISDAWYGNGLAWQPAIDAATNFFAVHAPEVVAFQEVFHSPECAMIPSQYHAGFVCESWQPGDPTVAEIVLGPSYQIACNLGKPDKCLAVRTDFGHFQGCTGSLCLDGLEGATVFGCGGGSRVGRGIVELVGGGTLTLVNVHGTSGIADSDQSCRMEQFAQVFIDLDGEPAANGSQNLVLGDFNVDPARWISFDPSAAFLDAHAPLSGTGSFAYASDVGFEAAPTYLGFFNLDHQISDTLAGSCSTPGVDGSPGVIGVTYFDHVPIVCAVPEPNMGTALVVGLAGLVAAARRGRLQRRFPDCVVVRPARDESAPQNRQSNPVFKPA